MSPNLPLFRVEVGLRPTRVHLHKMEIKLTACIEFGNNGCIKSQKLTSVQLGGGFQPLS